MFHVAILTVRELRLRGWVLLELLETDGELLETDGELLETDGDIKDCFGMCGVLIGVLFCYQFSNSAPPSDPESSHYCAPGDVAICGDQNRKLDFVSTPMTCDEVLILYFTT